MSDDVGVNLEDDGPALETLAPEPEPAAEPESQAAPDEPSKPAEVEAVEVAGQKYVPLSVLQAERQKRQELAPAAQRVAEYDAWMQQNRPYVEFLQANPDFLKQRQAPESPKPAAEPSVDPAALELARSLDLYDASGQPDVARAAKIQGLMAATAQQQARALVQPFENQQIEAAAAQNYNFLRNLKHPDGTQIDPRVVDFVWQQAAKEPNGLRTLANKDAIASIGLMAMGADAMWRKSQPVGVPKPGPVAFTEGSGGNPRTRPTLSNLEAAVAKDRGRSATEWTELTRSYKPNAANVLED